MNLTSFFGYKTLFLGFLFACLLACVNTHKLYADTPPNAILQSEKEPIVTHATAEEPFDPTKEVIEHISDAHDWHLWGHTAIPLPIILLTNKGLECFSSAKFEHGQASHRGNYYTYTLLTGKIKVLNDKGIVDEVASTKVYDFSFTKNVVAMYTALVILLVLFISIARSYRLRTGKAPKGLQSFMEPLILFVRDDIAKPNIGPTYSKFMPYLLTIFFFIWINNMLGLIPIFPGGANVTGNIAVTLVLGLVTFIVTNVVANKYYWKHIFAPSVPLWLYPILIPVELVGLLSKPFALIVRLFANISAGHIIVLSLVSLIFIFKTLAIAPLSVAFVLFMDVLELLVAFLQAFIFTMLTSLFIGQAVAEHAH